jgi:NADPH:quinone reductase-like Zn-dependent oxidoreductase
MKDVSLDPALAVAVVPNGATAYLALTQIARIRDGERVLVHGARGGLAAGFPGIARQLGASRVAGTVRASDLDAARQARLPYDEIIDSAELPARLAGERFDIVIDPVGGSVRTASIELLAPGDACSWSVTPAETGITRSTATGSGGGTWLFPAFRRGPSCRATRTWRGLPRQLRSVLRRPALPRPRWRRFPSPARQRPMNGWRTTR